jgi:hypothetical protein
MANNTNGLSSRQFTMQQKRQQPDHKSTRKSISLPSNYGERINFESLSKFDPSFRKLLEENDGRLDFRRAEHVLYVFFFLDEIWSGIDERMTDECLDN